MKCPYCHAKTHVTNSRSHNDDQAVWRRRQCKSCQALWTTDEQYDVSSTHRVSRGDTKQLQPLQRDVLFLSIWKALEHRKDATAEASALTDTIISKALAQKAAIIPVAVLTQVTTDTLAAFNPTAAAVYTAHRQR